MVDNLLQKLTESDHSAHLLMAEKRFGEAVSNWTECIRLSTVINGDEHPTTIVCIEKLGECLSRLGRTEEALGYLREAHQFFHRRADSHGEAAAISSKNLALCLVKAKNFEEAVPYLEMAIDEHITCYGTFTESTMRLQSVLADCLVALGRTKAVAKLGEEVLLGAIPSGLRQDIFLANVLQHLTRAYDKLQKNKRGLAISLRSAALARRIEGHRSLRMLGDLRLSSQFLWRLGRRDEAIATLEKVLTIIHKQHRKNEPYRNE